MGVLQELKTTLSMGARSNKYKIMLAAPIGATDDFTIDTVGKGGAIPAKTMGTIDIWTQGRKLVVAGDAQFENTWSLSFWNTPDHKLRDGFDTWLLYIDDMEGHKRGAYTHSNYMTEGAQIWQLNTSDNSVMAVYNFYNLWPTSISAIDMADESIDEISTFDVEFAYSHWVRTDTYSNN